MPCAQDNSANKFLYGLLPAVPVILAGITIIWQGGATLTNVLASVLLLFCAIGGGLWLWQCHANELAETDARWLEDENSKIAAVATYTNELERLLLTISPILSQQVMVSREHTEQEIISLTNRFANMVNELQQIVDSTGNTLGSEPHYHLDNVIDTSRDLLQPVLESLRRLHRAEHEAMGGLQKLSGHMGGLTAIAKDIGNLTVQLNLLALSATNETAVVEDSGQSVAPVAHDLRKLAEGYLQIEREIGDKVNDMVDAANAALALSENSALLDESLSQAESNINQALTHLGLALAHYRSDVETLRNNADQIRDEINNVLVALQFQDRVSQILSQVENNLLNLQKTIENIQQQGSNRDGNMLQVDEAVEHIEKTTSRSVPSLPTPRKAPTT